MILTETEILTGIKDYFDIRELVDKRTYNKMGQKCWMLFSFRLLHTILILRDELDLPFTANNWLWGGPFDERGYRSNVCDIVKGKTKLDKQYDSAHCLAMALDFDVKGMKAKDVRKWIIDNQHLLPYKIRLEDKMKDRDKNSPTYGQYIPINWVHLDVFYLERNKKVTLFNV